MTAVILRLLDVQKLHADFLSHLVLILPCGTSFYIGLNFIFCCAIIHLCYDALAWNNFFKLL